MNRIARTLVVSGLGLMAGLTIYSAPAQAAGANDQGASKKAGASVNRHWDDDEIVGYYRSLRTCERVGERGEDRGRWDDYDCYRIRRGPHRGDWALEVEYDRRHGGWGHGGFGHGFWNGGGFGHRPLGGFGPGFLGGPNRFDGPDRFDGPNRFDGPGRPAVTPPNKY